MGLFSFKILQTRSTKISFIIIKLTWTWCKTMEVIRVPATAIRITQSLSAVVLKNTYFKVINSNNYDGKIVKTSCFEFNNLETPTGWWGQFQMQPPVVFCKKGALKNFCKFHRKTPVLKSLFNKVASLKVCNFIKKRHQHRCSPVKFTKFLRTTILKNIYE